MASTRSRPRDREIARPTTGGVVADHATKINTVAIVSVIVIVAFLAFTSIGHVVDAATQHFMLFYAGVFALIALCTSVGLGLVSTDRMFLHPGQRVFIQAAHRAASFGALTFLIIHVVTEILAQRVHVIDSVVPFLSPFRTFYIGLGTIAGDIIILLAITGIMRGRFNASGKAWRWRAIHYTSYVCLVFGVWHGLLGGRPGKPYVDWSYGFVVAFVAVGVAVRVLSNSLRPKENLSAPPVDQQASSASAPLRAAAMLAQYGGTMRGGKGMLGAATPTGAQTMLSAPVTATVLPALPAGAESAGDKPQPFYEPGYDGPPRYLGAPRDTGPMPRPTGVLPRAATGSMPRAATGSMPRAATGSMPRVPTGSMPRVPTGPQPTGRIPTGPVPTGPAGPMPLHPSGPMPTMGRALPPAATGPIPRGATGAMPRAPRDSGPVPRDENRIRTGPYPVQPARPESWTGPMPRAATGAMPQLDGGWDTRPAPRSAPRGPAGPPPRGGTGPAPVWNERERGGTGPAPVWNERGGTGPAPVWNERERGGTGPAPVWNERGGTGPAPVWNERERGGTGPAPVWNERGGTGPAPVWNEPGPPRPGPGSMPYSDGRPEYQDRRPDNQNWPEAGREQGWPEANYDQGYGQGWPEGGQDQGWLEASHDGGRYAEQPPWDGYLPESDPGLRYREPGPGMPGYRGSREHRYGGDRY